jgi:aryl-alcohol dehydrogenase-like predicted oxidoreductase
MPERRPLGTRCGIQVSSIGTGLWAVPGSAWGPADDDATLAAIDTALEHGCNFFDTADVYGGGHSEVLLGRAMAGRRASFVVATKIGWMHYDEAQDRSQYDRPEKVIAGVEESLTRLNTEYVDVIQCHIDRPEPHTGHFIEAFRRLKAQGKVRAWGVSTSDIDHLRMFDAHGDCDVLQVDYSILNRDPERQVLPYCLEHGLGVIVRGPLAMGLLTGKFSEDTTFPDGDFRQAWREDRKQNEQFRRDLETAERVRSILPPQQSPAQFALRFTISHPAVSTVIPGARNGEQAGANCAVLRMPPLSEEEARQLDAIVPPCGGRKIWPA